MHWCGWEGAQLCDSSASADVTGHYRSLCSTILFPTCMLCIQSQYVRLFAVLQNLVTGSIPHIPILPSLPSLQHRVTRWEMSYAKPDGYRSVPRDFGTLIQTCSVNIQKITQNSRWFLHVSHSHQALCTVVSACLWFIMCYNRTSLCQSLLLVLLYSCPDQGHGRPAGHTTR